MSSARMELRGMNATETEFIDRFDRVQAPDCKGAMGENRRKSGSTSLCSEVFNVPRVEWRTKWKPQLVLR